MMLLCIAYNMENGKNVFDKKYDSSYGDGFYTNYSKPAEAGVTMTYRF